MNVRDSWLHSYPPRWNAAPSQELLVIRRNHQTGEISLDPLRWGLIPYWCMDPAGGRKPINAKCETVRDLPTFRDAYRKRRGIVPVDGFFEWRAIKGQKAKQPYAIAMKDGAPFGIAGIWENWKEPASGEWIRTFAIITADANELVAEIHNRMPLILAPGVKSRPAKVGDKLTIHHFNTGTRGFAAPEDANTAVCVLPGTELAFARGVSCRPRSVLGWKASTVHHTTAIFRQINKDDPRTHHDALEFPNGQIVLLTDLFEDQEATVLQLPAQPATAAEAEAQERVAHVG